MPEYPQRRLAAVMSADVVGFARLIGADEVGTLDALRQHRAELIDPNIAAHGGRIVKEMGDGLLLEFTSVVDAVRCAVAIQQAMPERNDDTPTERRIVFRIGINQGDVIIEGDDIFGDGVNIAARLQETAEPGGICISARVHDDIRDRLPVSFEDAGPLVLKNIARPVHAWHWRTAAGIDDRTMAGSGRGSTEKPAIAVLPFANLSSDPEQDYFAEGIAEDVITALSRFHLLLVIARNSTFSFRNSQATIRDICEALGARYVVEGSVRKAGARIRVTAQLVDGASGTHIWAERYDRDLDDVFAVQDDIANAIVAGVAPQSLQAEVSRATRLTESERSAWDLLMQARWHMGQFTRDGHERGRTLLEQALALDPGSAQAHSQLALNCLWSIPYGWARDVPEALATAARSSHAALRLDGDDAVALAVLALLQAFERRYDDALASAQKAVEANPNLALAHGLLCVVAGLVRDYDSVTANLETALRLSPRDPDRPLWYAGAGAAAYKARRYDETIRFADLAIAANPEVPTAYRQRAASLAMLGRDEDARADIARLLERQPGNTLAQVRQQLPYPTDELEHFIEGLRRAGLPEQ